MLTYFTLSCILSSIGSLLYFIWLRKRLTAIQAKTTLVVVVLLSWSIPFLVPELQSYTEAIAVGDSSYYENYNQWNVVNIEDAALTECYHLAIDSKDMCNCEVVQKANIVTFTPNPYYNFWAKCRMPLFLAFCFAAFVFLLEFLIKLGFLIYLASTGYKIRQEVDGTAFFLLYPNSNIEFPVAAFTLWYNYIIWSPLLDELNEQDRKIVILHEVAHLKQKDTWQQFILHIAKLFWWMMPFFYFIKRELDKLNEFAADDFAIARTGNPHRYATLLLEVKERQAAKKKISFVSQFAESLLKKRVLRIIDSSSKKEFQPRNYLLSMIFMIAVLWGTAAFALPQLQKHQLKLKEYELMKAENIESGKSEFCKSCLSDKYQLEATENSVSKD